MSALYSLLRPQKKFEFAFLPEAGTAVHPQPQTQWN